MDRRKKIRKKVRHRYIIVSDESRYLNPLFVSRFNSLHSQFVSFCQNIPTSHEAHSCCNEGQGQGVPTTPSSPLFVPTRDNKKRTWAYMNACTIHARNGLKVLLLCLETTALATPILPDLCITGLLCVVSVNPRQAHATHVHVRIKTR